MTRVRGDVQWSKLTWRHCSCCWCRSASLHLPLPLPPNCPQARWQCLEAISPPQSIATKKVPMYTWCFIKKSFRFSFFHNLLKRWPIYTTSDIWLLIKYSLLLVTERWRHIFVVILWISQLQLVKLSCKLIIIWVSYKRKKGVLFIKHRVVLSWRLVAQRLFYSCPDHTISLWMFLPRIQWRRFLLDSGGDDMAKSGNCWGDACICVPPTKIFFGGDASPPSPL